MESQKHATEVVNQNDEISLKDLVLQLQQWWCYLLGKWYIIFLAGVIGGGLGLTYALYKKPLYVADLTFILEDSKSSPLGAYAGIASQFGIDIGASSGSGVFSGDNIIEFLRTRLMVEKTLLTTVVTDGKKMTLAELYIDKYKLRQEWKNKPKLASVRFVDGDRKKFSLVQDSILNTIYDAIIKKSLIVAKPDKKLSFIQVSCLSLDETFSKAFTERLVKEAIDFYVETKIQRSKVNVDKLQEKADSLEFLLNKKTYSSAALQDLNLNPARRVAMVSSEVSSRDKMVLQTMYGEVIKNLEMSRMAMAQETPIVQIVDTPILPLKKAKLGKLKGIIIGGVIAGIFTIFFLIAKRLYRLIMQ